VNHRPAVPLSNVHIEAAFAEIRNSTNPQSGDKTVQWSQLKKLLTSEGEPMSQNDLDMCLTALIGETSQSLDGAAISAGSFAEKVLGFEDFDT